MNKKGFVLDLMTYGIVLFALAIVVVAVFYALNAYNDAWQSNSQIPQVSKDIVQHQTTKFVPVWDNFFIIAVIGYAIALVILSFSIRSHPVFAMLGIIIMVVFGIIAVKLSNAFNGFASASSISVASDQFSVAVFVMNHLPYFVIGFGLLFLVILYAKSSGGPTL